MNRGERQSMFDLLGKAGHVTFTATQLTNVYHVDKIQPPHCLIEEALSKMNSIPTTITKRTLIQGEEGRLNVKHVLR